MKKFYVLEKTPSNLKAISTDFLPADSVEIGDDVPKCPKCGRALGMRPLLGEIAVELDFWGASAGDVGFGVGDELLFSQRLKTAFESARLSGAIFQPVSIAKARFRKRKRFEIPPYYLALFARSRAVVDAAASEIDWEGEVDCQECYQDGLLKRFQRIVLVPDTWSGEDIFHPRGLPGTTITSQRFYEVCMDLGLPCDLLAPAEEFSRDYYPWKKDRK